MQNGNLEIHFALSTGFYGPRHRLNVDKLTDSSFDDENTVLAIFLSHELFVVSQRCRSSRQKRRSVFNRAFEKLVTHLFKLYEVTFKAVCSDIFQCLPLYSGVKLVFLLK